jgi:putative phage-type endonuclease
MEKQRSKEWFAKRVGRVTGSNVGAILGLNPHKTADDVLREMVRAYHGAESEFTGNVATEHGTFHEDGAQAEYEMETGNKVQECGLIVHPEHDWLAASPDGLISDDGLLEIKCPFGKRKDDNPEFLSAAEQPHYHAQMQVEMICANREWCDFFQWAPGGTLVERVYYNDNWASMYLPELKAFHALYLAELENPEHLQPKRKVIDTLKAENLVTEYDELADAIERATDRKKDILDELIQMAGEKNADICGKKLTQVERKGSVSYAKALKALAPNADLTKWTGKPTRYWKLS